MITFFTIPKPFHGHIATIQRNAIRSWIHVRPACQIILVGNEEGVDRTALEFGIEHLPNVKTNTYATPLLNSAFKIAQAQAEYPFMCYANSDMLFLSNLPPLLKTIDLTQFVLVGRRMDLEISQSVDFKASYWEDDLCIRAKKSGHLHHPTAIDYFVFPRGLVELPPFPVGRALWDNWLIFNARCQKIPVIDATRRILAIHQNHDYRHIEGGKRAAWEGEEVQKNWELVGPDFYPFDIRDADWIIDETGLRPARGLTYHLRRLMVFPALCRPLRPLIRVGRRFRQGCTRWLYL